MTDSEYQIIMDYLKTASKTGDVIEESEYINAVTEMLKGQVLDKYLKKEKFNRGEVKDMIDDALNKFITRLDPENNGEKQYESLTRPINGKMTNKTDRDFSSSWKLDGAAELTDKDELEDDACNYFKSLFDKGEPVPESMKERFFELPIQKMAYKTGDVFKGIFNVEKTDEELEKLKKNNEEEYKSASKGKNELDGKNIQNALNTYKTLNEKVKKTGFFDMLFHLPSYFKLKSNTKKMKEQMINKGINEKTIDEYSKGELEGKNAFARNRLHNKEIDENQYKEEITKKKSAPEKKTSKRFNEEKILNSFNNENEINTSKSKENIKKRLEDVKRRMDDSRSKSKKGNDKKQENITRWMEKLKKASEGILKYENGKEASDKKYSDYLAKMASLEENIPKLTKEIVDERNSLFNQYEMYDTDIKNWSFYDPEGLNSKGKPYTDDEKKIINRCKDYLDSRRTLMEEQKELQDLKGIKQRVDASRANDEAVYKHNLADYKKYEAKLASVGAMSKSEEIDENKLKTLANLNKDLEEIEDVNEDEYEEEEDELDFREKVASDTSLEKQNGEGKTKAFETKAPQNKIQGPNIDE